MTPDHAQLKRQLTEQLGLTSWINQLEEMRVEEDRHERWFGDRVRGHWLLRPTRFVLGWSPPEPLPHDISNAA